MVADRDRGGALLGIGLGSAGIFAIFLFLTFYLQATKGMTPLETGLAFMPMNLCVIAAATITTVRVLPRTGARPLIPAGMMLGALGLVLLTRVGVETGYASHVLPSLILLGLGLGTIFAPALATATWAVAPGDSGVASAMVSTCQQIGGSVGTALLSTVAASAVTAYVADYGAGPAALREAAVEGYVTAFWWAAGIFVVGALVSGALLRSDTRAGMAHGPAPQPSPPGAIPVAQPGAAR